MSITADVGLDLTGSKVRVLGPLTASGGVEATNLHSSGYMRVHYDSMAFADGAAGESMAINSVGALQFVSGTNLSPRAVELSGAILATDFPSYLTVMVTGSDQAVFLQLPVSGTAANTFGARDMGKIITIKKSGHISDTVDLVLTGSPAVHDQGLFEQGLSAITMSAPHAAINLMWNGSSYEIF